MKKIAYLIAVIAFVTMYNAEAKTRHFKGYANKDYKKALAQAKLKNKPVFMILFDSDSRFTTRDDIWQIKNYLSETVLELIADNFIEAIVKRDRKDRVLETYFPKYEPAKEPYAQLRLVILAPDGCVLYQENFVWKKDRGYKVVNSLIVLWEEYKTQRAKANSR